MVTCRIPPQGIELRQKFPDAERERPFLAVLADGLVDEYELALIHQTRADRAISGEEQAVQSTC